MLVPTEKWFLLGTVATSLAAGHNWRNIAIALIDSVGGWRQAARG